MIYSVASLSDQSVSVSPVCWYIGLLRYLVCSLFELPITALNVISAVVLVDMYKLCSNVVLSHHLALATSLNMMPGKESCTAQSLSKELKT